MKNNIRDRSDGSSEQLGETELLGLDFLTNSEGGLALQHVGGDGSDTLPDSIVGVGLEGTTLSDGDLVGLESLSNLSILGTRDHRSDGGDLASLLESEGEPVLLLSSQLLLSLEGDRSVEERR